MIQFTQTAEIFQLTLVIALCFVGLTVISSASGYALEYFLHSRRIWALPLDPNQTRTELIGNVVFLAIAIASFSVVLHLRVINFGADTALSTSLTFLAMYFGFQASYYALHRAMHTHALVRFHRWHHVSRVTTPLSGQSMSAVEAVGWMVCYLGVPLALSYIAPLSFNGWLMYIVYNVFGNIFGHANVEMVPLLPGLRYTSLFNNVFTYHSLHHARWTGHYGFATALTDRLMGTEWDDWMELHQRTSSGHPLTNLKVRGGAQAAVHPHVDG